MKRGKEKACTFRRDVPHPKVNPIRRVGQPRSNWTIEGMRKIWEELHEPGNAMDYGALEEFDHTNRMHIQSINLAAHMEEF